MWRTRTVDPLGPPGQQLEGDAGAQAEAAEVEALQTKPPISGSSAGPGRAQELPGPGAARCPRTPGDRG